MLSRLPILLGQLKAGNNLKDLKNEIRQLFYFLYRSNKAKQNELYAFDEYCLKMEKIIMNTESSKKNESKKFIYQFSDKLNLKSPNKDMALANLSLYYTWKNIKSEHNNNKFKISGPTWND